MVDLKTLDDEALYRIKVKCNSGIWPEIIGDKPEDFDSLPDRKERWQFWIRKTKQDYLRPINCAANSLITEEFKDKKQTELRERIHKEEYERRNEAGKISWLCAGDGYFLSKKERKLLSEYFSKQRDS